MDGVGEIDRRRAARQGDQIAFRREREDLVLEHLQLGMLEKFLRARSMVEDVEQLAQPAILPTIGARLLLPVYPMGRDAQLGDLMHLVRADLHLDALPLGPEYAGMERTVIIRLRGRDI